MTDKETPFIKKEVALLKCLKCGHEWQPRFKDNIPVACPSCKRKSWKTPAGQRKQYDWKDPVHKTWIGRKDWKQVQCITNMTESNDAH